jgi:hypothetical protein
MIWDVGMDYNRTKLSSLRTLSRYLGSVFNLGYGTKSEKSTLTIAVLSSIFLSLASGYTTYQGLLSYSPHPVALLITLGVQGILFAASWRIAFAALSREYSASLYLIFTVSLVTSVFFSYSSLYTKVYDDKDRDKDRVSLAIAEGRSIVAVIKTGRNEILAPVTFGEEYKTWKDGLLASLNTIREVLRTRTSGVQSEIVIFENKYLNEFDHGGTSYTRQNGAKAVSAPGEGPISDGYYRKWQSYLKFQLPKTLKRESDFVTARERLLRDLAAFEVDKSQIGKLRAVAGVCISIEQEYSPNQSGACDLGALDTKLVQQQQVINEVKSFDSACRDDFDLKDFNKIIDHVNNCISSSGLPVPEQNTLLKRNREFSSNEGTHAHHFIWITNGLMRLEVLALGSLMMALTIDILILLCGILGSRHESFLNIQTSRDLSSMQDYPLDIVLSTDFEKFKNGDPMLKRIGEVLGACEFNLDTAVEGYPATLSLEKIKSLGLHKELGVFLSMDLAKPLIGDGNEKIIGLRTKFILWMCDQGSRIQSSNDNLRDSLRDLADIEKPSEDS